MIRRWPVRLRLTLWFTALLAAVLALFGTIVFLGLRERLYASFDEQLLDQATLALATIEVRNGVPQLAPGAEGAEYFLRLVDANGHVVSPPDERFGEVPLDPSAVAAALGGRTQFVLVSMQELQSETPDQADAGIQDAQTDPGGQDAPADQGAPDDPRNQATSGMTTLRLVTLPVRLNGTGPIVGALQVGLDRDDINEALGQLLTVLTLASPLVLFIAATGGYLLAGRVLAPVAAITRLAGRISERDLHTRLDLDLPDDELGRLARTFDAMLARIEEAFERQRRFTADAAHELRTPLALMRAQVDLALARRRSADAYREALVGLDGDLQRLTGLVGTLLTLARADTGRLVPESAPFDLADTIALVAEQYAPLADEAGVSLRADVEPTPTVADEDLLMQVLVNLVDNALAHTPQTGIVTIGCRANNGQVHLWVADTGSGIAADHLPRVFDRFYRSDSGRARERGGAGLGLAISRAIVEAHGGTIALASQAGQGTCVDLTLPRPARLA
jgi:heavy metal sensor kinase